MQILDKMDKDLYWNDIKAFMGEAIRRKLSGKIRLFDAVLIDTNA